MQYILSKGRRLVYPLGGSYAPECPLPERADPRDPEHMARLAAYQCNCLGYDFNCFTISFVDTFHAFGLKTFSLDGVSGEYVCPGQCETEEDIERLYLNSQKNEHVLQRYLEAMCLTSASTENPISVGTFGPFTLAGHFMGIENFLISLIDKPEFAHKLVAMISSVLRKWHKDIELAGGQFVWVAEPLPVIVSEKHFECFALPELRQIFSTCSQAGFLHIPGKSAHLLHGMCNSGAQCLSLDYYVGIEYALENIPDEMVILGDIDSKAILDSDSNTVSEMVSTLNYKVRNYPNVIISSGGGIIAGSPYENIMPIISATKAHPTWSSEEFVQLMSLRKLFRTTVQEEDLKVFCDESGISPQVLEEAKKQWL